MPLKLTRAVFASLTVLFLIAPLIAILPLAFTSSVILTYPIPSWSLRWFEELFTADAWRRAIVNSLIIGGGTTKFQPVFVGDVAEVIARAVDGTVEGGRIYELGGPEVKTFRECLELILSEIGRSRPLVSLPWGVARAQASVMEWLPNPMMTRDQLKLLETDNVVSEKAVAEGRTLEGLGIQPTSLEAVLPSYLVRFKPHGQFDHKRTA